MGNLYYLDSAYGDQITFEEYPANPPNYTLNGFILTAIGLYDWGSINNPGNNGPHDRARDLFIKSIRSLKTMLPFFDINGFSVYDLGYITYRSRPNTQVFYHAFHIQLLHILYSITKEEIFKNYEELWKSYIFPNAVNPLTLTCDKNSPQLKGTVLAFNADMHDGSKHEFRFMIRDLMGRWNPIKSYSEDNSVIADTSNYEAGSYFVKVDAKNPGSTEDRDTFRIIKYDIVPIPVTDVDITWDNTSSVLAGSNLTVSAKANGRTGEYEYRFWLNSGNGWLVVQEYSNRDSWIFETSGYSAGVYYVQVDARSKGSVLYREASKVAEVNLLDYP